MDMKISGLLLKVVNAGQDKAFLTLSSSNEHATKITLTKYSVKGKAANILVSVFAGWKKIGDNTPYRFSCECTGRKGAFKKFAINGCDYFQHGNITQTKD